MPGAGLNGTGPRVPKAPRRSRGRCAARGPVPLAYRLPPRRLPANSSTPRPVELVSRRLSTAARCTTLTSRIECVRKFIVMAVAGRYLSCKPPAPSEASQRGHLMNATPYTAVIRRDGQWWIGWAEEVPGVN